MKNATIIRHIAFEDLGSLGDVLEERNYAVKYIEAGSDNIADIDALKTDLLVILGGPIGAYDQQDYPFITDELRLLKLRLDADLPTIGICLGAQLMARALGAKVYPGHTKEIGWSSIELSQAGKDSPLVHLATDYAAVLHWHGDTFDLPVGATHLASSSQYQNQAFSFGQAALALQFHPEVTTRGLERWWIGHACEIGSTTDVTISNLRKDTATYGCILENKARKLWHEWLLKVESKQGMLNSVA